MNVLKGCPRVDITISVNPEFELRLASVSVEERIPAAADFDGNQLEIGHARFSIFSEVGEITTGSLPEGGVQRRRRRAKDRLAPGG